jgi:hypothetical protein
VVRFTSGSRGKVPGNTCEKRIRNNNNRFYQSSDIPLYGPVA